MGLGTPAGRAFRVCLPIRRKNEGQRGSGMRNLKSAFGLAGAIVPVIYCGGLLYYFFGVGGSIEGVETIGLGPTIIGLGAVGLLFCIPVILKLMRIFGGPPGSGGPPGRDDRDEDGFDADAAIARYMAQRSAEAAPPVPTARPVHKSGAPAARPGFGRRGR